MPELIVFPDIEVALVKYLNGVLDVPVSTRVLAQHPSLRVKRVGGPRRNLVTESPMVLFEARADDEGEAHDIAALAKAYVHALPDVDIEGAVVRRVREVGGLQNFPDPDTDMPRFQFTAQIDTKGEVRPWQP